MIGRLLDENFVSFEACVYSLITLNSRLETAAAAIVRRITKRNKLRVFFPVFPSKNTPIPSAAILKCGLMSVVKLIVGGASCQMVSFATDY
jgi:hypothetical protein